MELRVLEEFDEEYGHFVAPLHRDRHRGAAENIQDLHSLHPTLSSVVRCLRSDYSPACDGSLQLVAISRPEFWYKYIWRVHYDIVYRNG